jgi:ABC-type antimicrobial peptide transport system, ATPase component
MKKIIIGENIVKTYGEGEEKLNVLDGVSVEITEGEFVSVMGPSGSGKSTLMFALSGMDGVNDGKIYFDEKELSALKENELADIRRNEMGFVFQQPTMIKNLNLLDNIILSSSRSNKKNIAKITEKARLLMKETGIDKLEDRSTTQVSGGQLQRAGICRALMNNPKIIFADEPTGALNSKSAHEIMNMFTEINDQGTAVMLVTHDAKVAARSERILFMRDGKIVKELLLPKLKNNATLEDRIHTVTMQMQEIGI